MDWREHIETNENILLGKPVIKGTRISVEHIIDILASGWTEEQILENYPRLSKDKLQAVFAYIQEIIKDGLIYNKPAKSV
ncbi:MAG: DUF433 domain-containing protein [Bacteroidales bacterium]